MAGGPSTPALAAAVASAGGFGFVAGGYLRADALYAAIEATGQLTAAPFGVNLFVPGAAAAPAPVTRYAERLRDEAARLGVALGEPRWDDDGYAAKLEVVLTRRPNLVSFTFGCPSGTDVGRLHEAGCRVAVTVTSAAEAMTAQSADADLLIVQGTEAGGHQGQFVDDAPNTTPLLRALAAVRAVTGLPVIAAGGIGSPADVRAALDAGALAVQVGTALLCTPEAGTSPVHRQALTQQRFADTVLTRAYSGRHGRGLRNRFADFEAPAAYPEIHHLTAPLRAAARAAGDDSVPNLWAGTGWRSIIEAPAAEVVRLLAGA
jgi:nitronate monooxygenase